MKRFNAFVRHCPAPHVFDSIQILDVDVRQKAENTIQSNLIPL
jgi:hypothetical protein